MALVMSDKRQFVAALQEVWCRGGVAVPLQPNHPQILNQIAELDVHAIWSDTFTRRHEGERCPEAGTLLLTSGSTGKPKVVYHTLAAHEASARGVINRLDVQPDDSWLLNLPTWHVAGLAVIMRCLLSGATLAYEGPTTHISMVGTQLIRLLRESEIPRYKAILLGGGPAPPVETALPIVHSYGMTEMASTIAGNGEVLPGRQLTLADDGEILVRGETLFSGYWSDGKLDLPLTSDGWFATGDYGKLENGRIVVLGRRDRMFVSGGENIHPEIIEMALLGLKGVKAARVEARRDPEFGHVPVAYVSPAPKNGLREELAALLPRFQLPKSFFELQK